jgi:LPXTG-motif cell wall-anchored protein
MTSTSRNLPSRWVSPRIPRAVTIALAATALLMGASTMAQAHGVLVGTSPADESIAAVVPTRVTLTFNEPVLAVGTIVIATGPTGPVQTGKPTLAGSTVTQRLRPGSPAGRYVVAWRATSADGHPVSGTFSFTATSPSAALPTPATPSESPTSPTASTASAAASPVASAGATSTPAGATGNTSTPWWVVGGAVVLLLLLTGVILARKPRSTPESERDPRS